MCGTCWFFDLRSRNKQIAVDALKVNHNFTENNTLLHIQIVLTSTF